MPPGPSELVEVTDDFVASASTLRIQLRSGDNQCANWANVRLTCVDCTSFPTVVSHFRPPKAAYTYQYLGDTGSERRASDDGSKAEAGETTEGQRASRAGRVLQLDGTGTDQMCRRRHRRHPIAAAQPPPTPPPASTMELYQLDACGAIGIQYERLVQDLA